ncbi:hypothetical protein AB0G15_39695 [Streptosporangium sp. NPDC023825]
MPLKERALKIINAAFLSDVPVKTLRGVERTTRQSTRSDDREQ